MRFRTLAPYALSVSIIAASGLNAAAAAPAEPDRTLSLTGMIMQTLYHELGHAYISLHALPVLGREEDAADNFANMMMIRPENSGKADHMAQAAAQGWLISQEVISGGEVAESDFMDEHGLDAQRGYNMLCHIVGSDPEGWGELAAEIGFDEDRVAFCVGEFEGRSADWKRVLDSASAGAEPGRFVLRYAPTETEIGGAKEALIKEISAIPAALEDLSRRWSPGAEIPVTFRECDGDANAYWDPEAREMTFCYDLVSEFESLLEAQ